MKVLLSKLSQYPTPLIDGSGGYCIGIGKQA